MDLTLDSSVIIAALRKQEPLHEECKALLQQVKGRKTQGLRINDCAGGSYGGDPRISVAELEETWGRGLCRLP